MQLNVQNVMPDTPLIAKWKMFVSHALQLLVNTARSVAHCQNVQVAEVASEFVMEDAPHAKTVVLSVKARLAQNAQPSML